MGNVTRAAELNGWLRMQRFTHRLHFATDEAVLGEVLTYFASSQKNQTESKVPLCICHCVLLLQCVVKRKLTRYYHYCGCLSFTMEKRRFQNNIYYIVGEELVVHSLMYHFNVPVKG